MTTLLLADHDGAALKDGTLKALTAARQLGGEVHVLVAGSGAQGAAVAAAKLDGVAKVRLADAPHLAHGLAEPVAALVVQLVKADGYEAVVTANSTTGKNVLPRVAALLDVMQVSDVMKVLGPDSFERPIYAGNAIQTVKAPQTPRVLTVRVASFQATGSTGAGVPVEPVTAAEDPGLSSHLGEEVAHSERPDLGSAKFVVSGGRALGSAEKFREVLEPLADSLGAAMGASRAAVDAGYAPNDWQVGQTGKAVAPDLYVAVGISGAIQHLAGMKDAKVIVAINKDEEAPIFGVADYGLVGDLFTLAPELAREIKSGGA